MRGWIVGLLAAVGLTMVGTSATAAPFHLETSEGRCTLAVNNGQIATSTNLCAKLTVSQDAKTGDFTVRYDFTDGLIVEFIGAGMQVNSTWIMMGIGKVTWTNPGGTPVQDLLNRADSPRNQVIGKCAVAMQENGGKLYEAYCSLDTAIGNIRADYKAPRSEDKK